MLELQRNVLFGQYVNSGSALHRLDPRVKLAGMVILVVAAFLLGSFLSFAILLPLVVLLQVISRVPLGYVLRGSRYFLGFLAFILVFEVLFFPPSTQSTVLWHWTVLSVTFSGLEAAGILACRVLLLYWVTAMIMLVTPVVDLSDAVESILHPLQRLRVPVNELGLVGVISVKFVPIFTAETERLATARAARGEAFDRGGPLVRAGRLGRLLVPVFISCFRRADALTLAMDSRCYRGGAGRTKLRTFQAGTSEWAWLLVLVAWVVLAWRLPGLA
ncbi:MAG: energy-coupling factor transporter transmembrane component T family protein [Chloroflexota bacterium]